MAQKIVAVVMDAQDQVKTLDVGVQGGAELRLDELLENGWKVESVNPMSVSAPKEGDQTKFANLLILTNV